MKTIDQKISSKKTYCKPEVFRIILDNSISLVMMTVINPPPRGGESPAPAPFASPVGDKPFA